MSYAEMCQHLVSYTPFKRYIDFAIKLDATNQKDIVVKTYDDLAYIKLKIPGKKMIHPETEKYHEYKSIAKEDPEARKEILLKIIKNPEKGRGFFPDFFVSYHHAGQYAEVAYKDGLAAIAKKYRALSATGKRQAWHYLFQTLTEGDSVDINRFPELTEKKRENQKKTGKLDYADLRWVDWGRCLAWIGLQEDINYPFSESCGGRGSPYKAIFEAFCIDEDIVSASDEESAEYKQYWTKLIGRIDRCEFFRTNAKQGQNCEVFRDVPYSLIDAVVEANSSIDGDSFRQWLIKQLTIPYA